MNKYYILNLDPQATHEWDRCVLRNPLTGARPDLNEEIAQEIDSQAGSYLIKVNLQIEILEQGATPPRKTVWEQLARSCVAGVPPVEQTS
ncbi:MAG: hypothetical protein RLZZ74_2185 [Cyanobacteriota bacterium]|jgi:hypothetical protein